MQERNLTANRNLDVMALMREAWQLTNGGKWPIWAPMLTAFLSLAICVGLVSLLSLIGGYLPQNKFVTVTLFIIGAIIIISFIYVFIGLVSGAIKTAIERARNRPVTHKTGFHSFSRVNIVLLTFLCFIPFIVPQFLLNLLTVHNDFLFKTQILQTIYGILIGPFLFLALPLAVDKTDSPLKAIMTSVKTGYAHWNKLVIISIVIEVVTLAIMLVLKLGAMTGVTFLSYLGLIIFAVAYIWFLPFLSLLQGVIYHKLAD